jgi:hypothetical protein
MYMGELCGKEKRLLNVPADVYNVHVRVHKHYFSYLSFLNRPVLYV